MFWVFVGIGLLVMWVVLVCFFFDEDFNLLLLWLVFDLMLYVFVNRFISCWCCWSGGNFLCFLVDVFVVLVFDGFVIVLLEDCFLILDWLYGGWL